MPAPDDLDALGRKLDEARRRREAGTSRPPPNQTGIAFRFATELVAALVVGGAIGWGIDRLAGTKPVFLIVFFVLGAAAGIRNVTRAAKEINAQIAKAVADDEEK